MNGTIINKIEKFFFGKSGCYLHNLLYFEVNLACNLGSGSKVILEIKCIFTVIVNYFVFIIIFDLRSILYQKKTTEK